MSPCAFLLLVRQPLRFRTCLRSSAAIRRGRSLPTPTAPRFEPERRRMPTQWKGLRFRLLAAEVTLPFARVDQRLDHLDRRDGAGSMVTGDSLRRYSARLSTTLVFGFRSPIQSFFKELPG
jgi:hypothetical protein